MEDNMKIDCKILKILQILKSKKLVDYMET